MNEWSIQEIIGDDGEHERLSTENFLNNLRVAIPGFIQDFNSENQTATIQPAIKEQVKGKWIELPLLPDVPVQFPRAGGYCVTFPVKKGDECLVIFNDMCIDSWWQSGKIQTQLEKRRHDLSDAVAILGITSVPKAIKDFSESSMQIRNEDNDVCFEITDKKRLKIKCVDCLIEVDGDTGQTNLSTPGKIDIDSADEITVKAAKNITISTQATLTVNSSAAVFVNTPKATVNGNATINGELNVTGNITSDGDVTASGISLINHVHLYAWTAAAGSTTTAPPS